MPMEPTPFAAFVNRVSAVKPFVLAEGASSMERRTRKRLIRFSTSALSLNTSSDLEPKNLLFRSFRSSR